MNDSVDGVNAVEDELLQEQTNSQKDSSIANAINPDPIDLTELVVDLGKGVLDVASSLLDKIDIDF